MTIMDTLEHHYRDLCDVEFTIERGTLWMLQTRVGKRTAEAAFVIAAQLVDEGVIDLDEALDRVTGAQLGQLMFPRFDPATAPTPLAVGVPAAPGAAAGRGEQVILVRRETNPPGRPARNDRRRRHPDQPGWQDLARRRGGAGHGPYLRLRRRGVDRRHGGRPDHRRRRHRGGTDRAARRGRDLDRRGDRRRVRRRRPGTPVTGVALHRGRAGTGGGSIGVGGAPAAGPRGRGAPARGAGQRGHRRRRPPGPGRDTRRGPGARRAAARGGPPDARGQPDARPARCPARTDGAGPVRHPGAGDRGGDRGPAAGRRRPPSADHGAAGRRGAGTGGGTGPGRGAARRLRRSAADPGRHHDRGATSGPDGQRDRRGGGLLLVRYQRPHPAGLGLLPRRRGRGVSSAATWSSASSRCRRSSRSTPPVSDG